MSEIIFIIFGTSREFTLGETPIIVNNMRYFSGGGEIFYFNIPFYKGLKQEYRDLLLTISFMAGIRVDISATGKIVNMSTWYFDRQTLQDDLEKLDPLRAITINLLLRDSKKLGYYCTHKLRKYIRNHYGKENS